MHLPRYLFLNYFKANLFLFLLHTHIFQNSFLTDQIFFYIITKPLPYFKNLNVTYSPKLTLNFSWLYEECLLGLDYLNQDPNSPQIVYFSIVSWESFVTEIFSFSLFLSKVYFFNYHPVNSHPLFLCLHTE